MIVTELQREHLWFMDTLVRIPVRHSDGTDGVSVIESFAPEGDSPPLHVHHTEDEVFHVLEGELRLRLGESELTVQIHVVLEADGTVATAEIVDIETAKRDAVYRSIALSARNAVLLSSPLTLPAGMTEDMRDMTLTFNTRDTLR